MSRIAEIDLVKKAPSPDADNRYNIAGRILVGVVQIRGLAIYGHNTWVGSSDTVEQRLGIAQDSHERGDRRI